MSYVPKDAKMNAATRHALQVQDARNEFYDVMADYSSFLDLNEYALTEEQKKWIWTQERCVVDAVQRWVKLLGGTP